MCVPSIIPEAWNIQARKCLRGTVAFTSDIANNDRRGIFLMLPCYWNILECCVMHCTDATLLFFWLWCHCKVYWNANVPNLRAQKMMHSQISYEIFIVYLYLSQVHKKFDLNCIHNDLFQLPWRFLGKWSNSNICRAVTDGPFSAELEICQGCMFNPKKEIPYWPDTMFKFKSIFN